MRCDIPAPARVPSITLAFGARILSRFAVTLALGASGTAFAEPPQNAREQTGGAIIDFAFVDSASALLTIEGRNLAGATSIELGGESLTACAIFDTVSECQLDPGSLHPGTYDLMVLTGGGTLQYDNLSLAIGAVGPQGPIGTVVIASSLEGVAFGDLVFVTRAPTFRESWSRGHASPPQTRVGSPFPTSAGLSYP